MEINDQHIFIKLHKFSQLEMPWILIKKKNALD